MRAGLYYLGRLLQVTGLVVTVVAATAFFGTPSTLAMLRMMLAGVVIFLPGWWLTRRARRAAGAEGRLRAGGGPRTRGRRARDAG